MRGGRKISSQGDIRSTSHLDMNLTTVYVDREYAVKVLGIESGEVSQLMVKIIFIIVN